ncbi:MAG: hypothetical protein SGJ05_00210 [bacterium]|nr:hypothetical protein [bacterium]
MSSLGKTHETQLKNIQTKTGKSLTQLYAILSKSKRVKHSERFDLINGGNDAAA